MPNKEKPNKQKIDNYVNEFLDTCVDFVAMFRKLRSMYETYNGLHFQAEQATQDILHKLELNSVPYKERCKLMTLLSNIRRDRRYYKDKATALYDFIEVVEKFEVGEEIIVKSINQLGNAAGVVRRKYANRENRIYTPRVIKELKIENKEHK